MTSTTLSPLQPYARLLGLADNLVKGTTTNLLPGTGRSSVLSAASRGTVKVPLADAGDGTSVSFATRLLQAGGGPGLATPVPMLLSLSLDGGVSYDFHRVVMKPLRDLHPQGLTLTESGEDIWSLYALIRAGGGRGSLAGCSLADVLGGKLVDTSGGVESAIIPLTGYQGFISADQKLPFVSGLFYVPTGVKQPLFQDVPGNPSWDADALKLLQFVAVVPTQGMTTGTDLAFTLPTDLDDWADNPQHALSVLVEKLAVLLDGDPNVLGSRCQYVADCSDHALNVAGTLAGVVCDGTPTFASPTGTYGYSNARTSGHEVSRSVVVGSVGAPSGLLFTDSPSSAVLDETAEALIWPGVTIEPDNTIYHGRVSFDGGASDAGFPAGGTITALTQVNRSAGDDAWSTCLPLIGVNVSDKSGGVYLYDTLGLLVPLNKSQSIPVLDMVVDTINNVIDIATPGGCYHRTDDVTNTSAAWTLIGGLTARVVRVCGVPTIAPDFLLLAQVQDTTNSALDGVYRYWPSAATAGLGFDGWVKVLPSANVLDFQSTDDHSLFYIDKSDQNAIFLCFYGNSPPTTTRLALPSGVSALRLDRVTGATIDTVYITTTGDTECAYYTAYTSGAWQTPVAAKLAVGQNLQVNRFVGPLETINGVNHVSVLACTANGLFYATTSTPTSTGDWTSCNDQNGLSGVSVTQVSAGAAQLLLGITTNRVYAATPQDLYMSSNSGLQFDAVTQGKVDDGPIFKDLVVHGTGGAGTGAPPSNSIRTVGPSSSSPLGLASSTHVQVTSYLGFGTFPTGGYMERQLTQRGAWAWAVVDSTCPFTALQQDQLTDVEANATQDVLTASAIVLAVSKKWLYSNSTPYTTLKVPSSFTQTNAVLRRLQPGQLVHVTWNQTIPAVSSTGDIIDTVTVSFSNTPFYVIDHAWSLAQDGSNYADTQTTLCSVLRSAPLTPAAMATTFQRQLRDLKLWTVGRRR